ncbi:MAG: hypothetical protein PWR10_1619 [Halanaerobiales bacterium]|nr:hypothetical protein [Halanaerobiales bacterium]
MLEIFKVKTSQKVELVDITSLLNKVINDTGINEGIIIVYTPHTTAALTINEGADPDVKADILNEINKIIPFDDNYRHFEGNSAAHIKSSLFGVSETIIIENGRMLLGRWQKIYFCEFDGPRTREVFIKVIKG